MLDWIIQNWIEIVGTLAGFIYVFLEIKQNSLMWLVGVITSSLYVIVFFNSRLYADMSLNIYYVIISIYGWYCWLFSYGKDSVIELQVSHIPTKKIQILSGITIIIFLGMWYILHQFTNSDVPMWDSLVTALSITATWMLTHKYIEQWFVWIVVNGISIGLFLSKGLYPTTVLFVVYFALSIVGYFAWKKEMRMVDWKIG